MKITFIGGGNMGEAILAALLKKGITTARDITVSDAAEARRQYLAQTYSVKTTADNRQAVAGAEVVVLAIKPQIFPAVTSELAGKIEPLQIVLSIMAGVRIAYLVDGLKHKAIVRSMPNTPAQIGEGVTVWTATPEVSTRQIKQAGEILGALGRELYVDNERYIDMATAVSGSGPAYLFYFVEAFTEAAVAIGWTPEQAKELVMSTVLGAAHLLEKSGEDPAELRRAVTSTGGTTAAATSVFDEGKFKELVTNAVRAALERAKELGK